VRCVEQGESDWVYHQAGAPAGAWAKMQEGGAEKDTVKIPMVKSVIEGR
jgi:hypothetical protein